MTTLGVIQMRTQTPSMSILPPLTTRCPTWKWCTPPRPRRTSRNRRKNQVSPELCYHNNQVSPGLHVTLCYHNNQQVLPSLTISTKLAPPVHDTFPSLTSPLYVTLLPTHHPLCYLNNQADLLSITIAIIFFSVINLAV